MSGIVKSRAAVPLGRVLVALLMVGSVLVVGPTEASATPSCRGHAATIVGTNQDDVLRGTSGDDVIVGRGGDDRIRGRGGDDIICGGNGEDDIHGGSGDDEISGGRGNDDIRGGRGSDVIAGDGGRDDIRGGAGDDEIDGGGGSDEVEGGSGDDVASGGQGNDELDGGAGNDVLNGDGGSDSLEGNSGDDSLYGGGGTNRLDGGSGIDHCEIGRRGTKKRCETRQVTLSVSAPSGIETSEDGGQVTFVISVDGAPSGDVTIGVSSSDDGEGVSDVTEVVIEAADWQIQHVVTVTGVDDNDVDGDQPFTIVLSPASGGGLDGFDLDDVELTNVDDDVIESGSIGDYIWIDWDFDGIQDPTEDPRPGVILTLVDDTGASIDTATSDPTGFYEFLDVEPGTYQVRAPAQSGWVRTRNDEGNDDTVDSDILSNYMTASFEIGSGEHRSDIDVGYQHNLAITGIVWDDLDGDGLLESGEPRVEGVEVKIFDQSGSELPSSPGFTNINGGYSVIVRNPGTFDVQVVAPDGRSFTLQNIGGNESVDSDVDATGLAADVEVTAPTSITNLHAGLAPQNEPPVISTAPPTTANEGELFSYDADASDPDGPTEVWRVLAGDTCGGSIDSAGIYTFTPVGPNPPASCTLNIEVCDGAPAPLCDRQTESIDIAAVPAGASIGDRVWIDLDRNGLQDDGEPGFEGLIVTLSILGPTGPVEVERTTTDGDGNYVFEGLEVGQYIVRTEDPNSSRSIPVGYAYTVQNAGSDDTVDSDASNSGTIGLITVASGTQDHTNDIGLVYALRVDGNVWDDLSGDGILDISTEDELAGVTVELLDESGLVIATDETSGNTGLYIFGSLDPGTYVVRVVPPEGATFSPQDQGTLESRDSDVDEVTGESDPLVLDPEGSPRLEVDAGLVFARDPGTIGDFVWLDLDRDGIQDVGEPGIERVEVELRENNIVIAATLTDAIGLYSFADVSPGAYSLRFSGDALGGLLRTISNAGSDDDVDSDLLGQISVVLDGEDDLSNDAGFVYNLLVSGFVFEDVNADGRFTSSADERLIGHPVELLDESGTVVATDITNAAGQYVISRVDPGTYRVRVVSDGDLFTERDVGSDGFDSDVDPITGESDLFVLSLTERPGPIDAGLLINHPPTITNVPPARATAFEEYRFDGESQDTDGPDAEWSVLAADTCRGVVNAVTGVYMFTPVAAGTCELALQVCDLGTPSRCAEVHASIDIDAAEVSIGDFVWLDLNKNGIQDIGEPGFEGLNIDLLDLSSNVLQSTTSDSSGGYVFAGLPAAAYRVTAGTATDDDRELPPGLAFTLRGEGGDEAVDSDVSASSRAFVNLLQGGDDFDVDIGIVYDLVLSGRVWEDLDGDGIQGGSEPGSQNAEVQLLDGSGALVSSLTTDVSGDYRFDRLDPGDYRVRVVAPAGSSISPRDQGSVETADSDVDPTSGESDLFSLTLPTTPAVSSVDAGIVRSAVSVFGDFVWLDLDGNGIQDTGEPGIEGVIVQLVQGSTVVATTTTDSAGRYSIAALEPGTYSVRWSGSAISFLAPTGVRQGTDPEMDSDLPGPPITVTGGEIDNSIDAGLVYNFRVFGTVFDDVDGNGNKAPGSSAEPGIAGVEVELLDPAGDVLDTATTSTSGSYSFSGLGPGSHRVRIVAPQGLVFSPMGQSGITSDVDPETGESDLFVLDYPDDRSVRVNGGLFTAPLPATAMVGDRVWIDLDRDGVQDEGEPPYTAGYAVRLIDDFFVELSTVSGPDGMFIFEGVEPGSYWLDGGLTSEGLGTPPPGFQFAPVHQGSDPELDSESVASQVVFDVVAGTDLGRDIGFVYDHRITGNVWRDTNLDGIEQTNEPDLAGIVVELLDDAGAILATTTTSGSSGFYEFRDLAPGTYRVRVTPPPGGSFTLQGEGANDFTDSDVDPATGETDLITLGAPGPVFVGGTDAGIVFPPVGPTDIGDFIWLDENRNGIQDEGESGISGVTVRLSAGPTILTTVTDEFGLYFFGGVAEGDYTVLFSGSAMSGLVPTGTNRGLDDSLDSDVPQIGLWVVTAAGGVDLDNDAGFVPEFGVTGTVWEDENGNGVRGGFGEDPPVSDVTVRLLDEFGAVLATDVTTVGFYRFDDLDPGTYEIEVVDPGELGFTLQDAGFSDLTDSDVDPVSGRSGLIVLSHPGDKSVDIDAGLLLPSVNDAPQITSNPSSPAGVGALYTYSAQSSDEDGPLERWTTTAADTCGGTIGVTTGDYTFTPIAAGTCDIGIEVCDLGAPNLCDSQTASINLVEVNQPPEITTSIPGTAIEGTEYSYDADATDPDGPAELWSVLAADNCGGTIDGDGNYTFVPAAPGPCAVSIQICDGAAAQLCDQQSGVVFVSGTGNGAPEITSVPSGSPIEDVGFVYRPVVADDGPEANWSVLAGDTCGGFIGVAEIYIATVSGPVPPGSCVLSIEVCDGASPSLCAEQTMTLTVTAVNDSPSIVTTPSVSAVEDIEHSYAAVATDPDGPSEVWSVLASDTCGGSIGTASGEYVFTPEGPIPMVDCTLSVEVCDGATDELCAQQSVVISIGSINDAPVITSLPGSAAVGHLFSYDAEVADPDGPAEVWSALATDTCGGVIGASTGVYTFTPVGPAGCVLDIEVCDAGVPNLCDRQIETISLTTGSIGDRVWIDHDQDGVQDVGEPGLGGMSVSLLDGTGSVIQSTTTDAAGGYSFDGLAGGDYEVHFDQGDGEGSGFVLFTLQGQGADDSADSDANQSGFTGVFTLANGESNTTIDAGVLPELAFMDFRTWSDTTCNGIIDGADPSLSGVLVEVLDAGGSVVASAVTDSYGDFFTELVVGATYTVRVSAPPWGTLAPKDQGPDWQDSDIDPLTGLSDPFVLDGGFGEGGLDLGAGFCEVGGGTASIGDRVWLDTNKNGIQDTGESGMGGVTVLLSGANGSTAAVTASDGSYAFTGLVPGTYRVFINSPAGFTYAAANQGVDDTVDSDLVFGNVDVVIAPGSTNATVDAGFVHFLQISGWAWRDLNGDGVRQEGGLSGVLVEAFDSGGAVVGTATTAGGGNYSINGLAPGDYTIRMTPPTGWSPTVQGQGGDESFDSDIDGSGVTAVITLVSPNHSRILSDGGFVQPA